MANGQCEPLKIQGFHKFRLTFKGDDETGRDDLFHRQVNSQWLPTHKANASGELLAQWKLLADRL
ncbi:hypothetical protein [Marinobacterium rhizophilum]|uniref:hypothetical protein n=1 Tax=Marinobacterium rhizophilum TaxID=420402 RepID=UPI00037AF218|nr:hypothetical protein [Marinobacterium rhizophilum]